MSYYIDLNTDKVHATLNGKSKIFSKLKYVTLQNALKQAQEYVGIVTPGLVKKEGNLYTVTHGEYKTQFLLLHQATKFAAKEYNDDDNESIDSQPEGKRGPKTRVQYKKACLLLKQLTEKEIEKFILQLEDSNN